MIQFFIKKSVVTICLNLSILLIGYFSLGDIANEFIPAVEIPAVGVVFPTTFLHHDEIERSLVNPVEKQLLSSGDVEKIETTLDQDKTIMFIFYKWSVTPEESLQRARQVVSAVPRPAGVLEPIFVLHRPSMSPIYRVAFSGVNSGALTQRLSGFLGEIERLPGVAEVKLAGASPERGVIEVDPLKAARHGVSVTDIIKSAKEKWSFRHLWSNEAELEGQNSKTQSQLIRLNLRQVQDLNNAQVYTSENKKVPLRWISKIQSKTDPPSVFVGDQKDGVILEILKAPGTDAIKIVDTVKARIGELKKKNPDLFTTEVYNEGDKIKQAQTGVLQNFAVGVTLNSLVLIIFLGSIIGAVVASCVFPTAILGTLFIMKISGISLNIFALNGFSLASGMITDASIVVLEAIMRRFQMGQPLFASSYRGTRDVMLGVFASTLTTAAVIVPISIQSGVSSKLFSDLGIVLVATQFISLIAVFTFVPWICAKILSSDDTRPKPIEILYGGSSQLVKWMNQLASHVLNGSVNNRFLRLGVPLGVTFLSVIMLMALPESEFLPKVAANVYSVTVPVDRIALTREGDGLVRAVSQTLGQNGEIDWVVTSKNSDSLKATFKASDKGISVKVVEDLAKRLDVPKERVIIIPLGPAPSSEPMSYDGYYYINSKTPQKVKDKIVAEFCSGHGISDCTTVAHYAEPKWLLTPKVGTMAQSKTNVLESTLNVAALTQDLDIGSIAGLGLPVPVLLKYDFREMLPSFPMLLGDKKNHLRPLGSLFENELGTGANSRFRKNGQNYEPIYFKIHGITIGQAVARMESLFKQNQVSKHLLSPMGTIETMKETFTKMIQALCLSAVLILLVLVIQFKSVSQALIIMYSIPLSVGGAVAGLLITGETLNVGVIVGFILLIGIIVNNGILLMDAINQRRISGMAVLPAVLEAVESRTRPILMTTFSTILGMLPTLVLEAEGKELYQGMAIVNIFGMGFGTLLTLVVIPVVIRSVLSFGSKRKGISV